MSNNKQSAVEYLVEQLFPKVLSAEQYYHIEQAKAMHKEEIIYSVEVGYTNGYLNKEYDGHQHYNETFGK